jgi:hypothetical protein
MVLFSGCQTELLKTTKKVQIEKKEEPKMVTLNDSTFRYELVNKKWIKVSIINSANHFSMLVNRFDVKDSIDFDKEHITAKTPEFVWMNNQFICITTWWSGPFSSSLIIPVKREKSPFIYFVKGIIASDVKHNHVVYSERIFGREKVRFAVEDLVSRKVQFIDWKIPSNQHDFPYCDSLVIKNKRLKVWNLNKIQEFQIN